MTDYQISFISKKKKKKKKKKKNKKTKKQKRKKTKAQLKENWWTKFDWTSILSKKDNVPLLVENKKIS